MKTIYFSRLLSVAMLAVIIALPSFAQDSQEGSLLHLSITTGSDDLRGGNTAYIRINRINGTSSEEFVLGGGWGQNSVIEKDIELPGIFALNEIRGVTIRHDGSPKGPFDTYDNWDLQAISVTLMTNDGNSVNIYNSANDRNRLRFVQRFTGQRRTLPLFRQRTQ